MTYVFIGAGAVGIALGGLLTQGAVTANELRSLIDGLDGGRRTGDDR